MSTSVEGRKSEVRREYVPVCWCWPGTRFGGYFWGTLLVLGGGVWLMANMGLLTEATAEAFWPLALVALGLAYLLRASGRLVEWPGR